MENYQGVGRFYGTGGRVEGDCILAEIKLAYIRKQSHFQGAWPTPIRTSCVSQLDSPDYKYTRVAPVVVIQNVCRGSY